MLLEWPAAVACSGEIHTQTLSLPPRHGTVPAIWQGIAIYGRPDLSYHASSPVQQALQHPPNAAHWGGTKLGPNCMVHNAPPQGPITSIAAV